MALHLTFKVGKRQSFQAVRYFSQVASDMVAEFSPGMRTQRFVIQGEREMPLRIWSIAGLMEEHVLALLPWIRQVGKDIRRLENITTSMDQVQEIVEDWAAARQGATSLFIEQLNPAHAFTSDENLDLTLGILGGETVLISAPRTMYVKQEFGLYGLAVAGQGSYLVEEHGREKIPVQRRA